MPIMALPTAAPLALALAMTLLGAAAAVGVRSVTKRVIAVFVAMTGAVLAAAALGGAVRARPLLVARYYVLTTASVAAGLWDHLRHGTPAGWAPSEGTR